MSGGISTAEPKGRRGWKLEGAHAVGSSHNDRRREGKEELRERHTKQQGKRRGEESPQKNLTERSFNMDQFMSP